MTTKEKFIKETKEAKTIKVKTVVISVVFIAALLASFVGGWFIRSDFDATIKAQVNSQVQELSQAASVSKQ